jgi:hypothetical protein
MPAPVVAAAAAAAARTAAPGLFAGLMNALRPALMSGGLSTGFSMLMGEDLPTALLYGAADTLGSAAAVGGLRAIRPGRNVQIKNVKTGKVTNEYQPSRLETPVNFAASLGTGNLVSAALGRPSLFGPGRETQQQSQSLQEADLSNINLDQLTEPELAQLSDEQILTIIQQNNQRDQVNRKQFLDSYLDKLAPGTMFQTAGLPNRQSMNDEFMRTEMNTDFGEIQKMMGAIAGV